VSSLLRCWASSLSGFSKKAARFAWKSSGSCGTVCEKPDRRRIGNQLVFNAVSRGFASSQKPNNGRQCIHPQWPLDSSGMIFPINWHFWRGDTFRSKTAARVCGCARIRWPPDSRLGLARQVGICQVLSPPFGERCHHSFASVFRGLLLLCAGGGAPAAEGSLS